MDPVAHSHHATTDDEYGMSPPMPLAWLLGIVLASGLLWCSGYVFSDAVAVYVKDDKLDSWVRDPSYTMRYRREGWGTTHIAPHSITGSKTLPHKSDRTIVLWGDSYVEAVHVDDAVKMHNRFNRMWAEEHPNSPLRAYAVSQAGYHMFDYLKYMSKLRGDLGHVLAHVIVVHTPEDLTPLHKKRANLPLAEQVEAHSQPTPQAQRFRRPLRDFELSAIWILSRNMKDVRTRWAVGPIPDKPAKASVPTQEGPATEYWNELLDELDRRADAPILFLYLPTVPFLENGELVFDDDRESWMHLFGELCAERGIPFVSLKDDLIAATEANNKLPRGFPNTLPGEGHLNDLGHSIVAQRLFDLVEGLDGAFLSR